MPGTDSTGAALTTLISAMRDGQRGDLTALDAGTERARELLADQPPSADKDLTRALLRLLGEARKMVDGQEPDLPTTSPAAAPTTALQGGIQAVELWLAMVAASRRDDVCALRRVAAASGALLESIPAAFLPARITAATTAGLAEAAIARLDPADRATYHRSMSRLAEAMELTGPQHKQWRLTAQEYAAGLRLADEPDRPGSRRLGRSVLRAHARQVLLQSGTEYAMEAARGAAADARAVAAWCVDDAAGDPAALDDLAAVLDAGRGLVLQAATVSRAVSDQLTAAGHADLAAEWQAIRGLGRDLTTASVAGLADALAVPDDLRMRVLHALDPDGAEAGSPLLALVSVAETRHALAAVGADALVYLVPADVDGPGLAVVLPVAGTVSILTLPELRIGPDSPVGGFVTSSNDGRDVGPIDCPGPPGTSVPPPGSRLDDVCRLAWSACMADLLRYAERWHQCRPARLVLVPMGMLGVVPWHAAYDGKASRRRYAVEDLVLSYGVSARMLCASSRHPLRAPQSALVIGDPEDNLPFAGIEARAVHRTFYPFGTYLGRSETDKRTGTAGRGTISDVLAWISAGNRGPSLLHLACHGRVDPAHPADAHLVLADGILPASRLLEASRLAEVELDRVFLAACTTNVTGSDYDEAFTLATAFLAAGVHTAFGSLWTIPNTSTSLLMFMVHHFLNGECPSPADALHRAQLWMLDPDRQPPSGMPADLVAHCDRADIAQPLNWAAFTHLGR